MFILIQETFNLSDETLSRVFRSCSNALERVRREPSFGDTGAKVSVGMSRRQCLLVGEGKVEASKLSPEVPDTLWLVQVVEVSF